MRRGITIIEMLQGLSMLSMFSILIFVVVSFLGKGPVRAAKQGMTLDRLKAIRAALRAYSQDTKGMFPSDPRILPLAGIYLDEEFPQAAPWEHAASAAVTRLNSQAALTDGEGWAYVSDPGAGPSWGRLFVNCTHTDSHGKRWADY